MGKIELDHTGSGSGITLSSDGTSLLLDGTAIGGGGGGDPDLYADNYDGSTTQPSATGNNAVALGALSTSSGAISLSFGNNATASAANSVALGRNAKATNSYSFASGNSYSSGSDSVAMGIANNTAAYGATNGNSVALGDRSKASGSRGIAIGGYGALASGASSLAFGYQATANQSYASGFGYASKAYGAYSFAGTESHASGSNSVALGLGDTSTSYGALHDNGVALGYQATTSAAKQIALGSSTAQVKVSGAYTLPTADGTNGQVLTTDGSGAVTFADASSGGGADLYAANESSPTAQPSATGANAVAIGEAPTASGNDSFAVQGGTASGNGALAIGRNVGGGNVSLSRANSTVAIMGSTTTNNHYSTAIGLNSSAHLATVGGSGMGAMALGGSYASGTNSFAAAIGNNSSSYGATHISSISIGNLSKAHNDYAVAIGYQARTSSHSSIAIGREAGASGLGTSSIAIGHEVHTSSAGQAIAIGKSNIANGWYSVALGNYARTNGIQGKFAYSCDYINNGGDAQTGMYVLHVSTTDATATALTTTGTSAGSNNQLIVQNNSAYAFHGTIVAREKASEGTDCAAWKVEGLIRREANAGTTVLVNSATTVLNNASSWGMALSADTTNGCLKIAVTGAASTNIRWVGTINTSELTYA